MRANPEIDALLAELLDSGVSPKYVSRLAGELADHYADLEAEATRLGVPAGEAAEDARLRLGECSAIATEFERRPELKSWVYRSRWLERLLRVLVGLYLVVRTPARVIAASQAAMLRYTAATAAGASVTGCILLLLTELMPSDLTSDGRLVERAGFVLAGWEREREPLRAPPSPRTRHDGARDERALAPREAPPAPDSADADRELGHAERAQEPHESAAAGHDDRDGRARFERPRLVRTGVLLRPTHVRFAELQASTRASLQDTAHVTLADLRPSVPLAFDNGLAHDEGGHDYSAIFKVAPEYPVTAARRGIEGHVILEFTVTRTGTVSDVIVVESSHALFNRAALEAAREFRYTPRVIRGEAVDVHGVRVMIRFELEA